MCFFNRHFVWLAALLLGSLAPSSSLLGRSSHSEEACPKWRFVALKENPDEKCPLVLNDENQPERIEAGLNRFCVYEQQDGDVKGLEALLLNTKSDKETAIEDETQTNAEKGKGNGNGNGKAFTKVDKDCAVVGSLASGKNLGSLLEQSWQTLEQHFDIQVGRTRLANPRRNVRLVILDTQPLELKKEGNSPHGWSLAHIGRHLVCDESFAGGTTCVAKVSTELAMPWKTFDPDNYRKSLDLQHGGYFGTVYDLAEAIGRELETVEHDEHLVLNLSLGWDGETFGGLFEKSVDEMPLPVQILYHVLEKAACKGVLVIAAAGNRVGGPTPETGLLLPAAWADRKVGEKVCPMGSDLPLVYAVGGVDRDSNPLSNARKEGMPELVAFADHAVVGTPTTVLPSGKHRGPRFGWHSAMTKTYTGSSVAAAVASAAAAAVWSQQPDWDAHQVMQALYDSGCDVQKRADFVSAPPLGTPSPLLASSTVPTDGGSDAYAVHRIHLQRALNSLSWAAEEDLSPPCPGSEPPDLNLKLNGQTKMSGVPSKLTLQPTESALAYPWTGPQPQDPPCPNCTLEPPPPAPDPGTSYTSTSFTASADTYTLYIEIDEDWPSEYPLHNATLVFPEQEVHLNLGPLSPRQHESVGGICGQLVNGPGPIILRFTVYDDPLNPTEERMVENPVLVAR